MNKHFSGPADIALQFGCYLVPLAVLEVTFRSRRYAGGLLLVATGFMIVGIGGATAFMWWPYIK